jgi:mono/diheme cytochrome c family protein
MLRKLAIFVALAVLVGAAAFWYLTIPSAIPASALPARTADLANGRTVFYAGGCASCHATPGQPDRNRLGGGVQFKSPFGIFYAPNISPDANDGIGAWSEAQFATALMKGTAPDGQHLYPVLPYTTYQRMRLEDARDLFAYVKTLPAVQGKARPHALSFPFNVRRGLGLWKLIYLDGAPFAPDPKRPPQWNRGAYLVEALGHCAECHSPRNSLGGIKTGQRFAGGPNPEGEGWIPNITQQGLKEWSEKDVAYMLETGNTPEGDSVGGLMAAVVRNTAELAPDDRAAIAAYIKSLPPVQGPTPPQKKSQ